MYKNMYQFRGTLVSFEELSVRKFQLQMEEYLPKGRGHNPPPII